MHKSFLLFRMKYISRRHEIFFYVKSRYLRRSRVPFPCLLFQLPLNNTSIRSNINFTFVRRREIFGIIRDLSLRISD